MDEYKDGLDNAAQTTDKPETQADASKEKTAQPDTALENNNTPQPEPEDEEEDDDDGFDPTSFAGKINALSQSAWKKLQIAVGALIGLSAGALLFFMPETATFGQYKFIIAVVLVIIVPRILENQAHRDFRTGRLTMVVIFAACLVYTLIKMLVSGQL